MSRALLVVDCQPTFCEGGELPVTGGNACVQRIADYISSGKEAYDVLVSTQDWHIDPGKHFSDSPDFIDTWPPHGVAGSTNAQLHPALATVIFNISVKKGAFAAAYSGFEGCDEAGVKLADLLKNRGVNAVDVVGIAESHCVCATVLDALSLGFSTRVITDLTVPVSPELGMRARQQMAGANAQLLTCAQL